MLAALSLPEGLVLVRTTDELDAGSAPAGLLRAHRLAPGVWGRLRVLSGSVVFVLEGSGESRRLGAGDRQVIEPDVAHHVEPDGAARFTIELHRRPDSGPRGDPAPGGG